MGQSPSRKASDIEKCTMNDVARVHMGKDRPNDETVELRLLVGELARTAQMREHLATRHNFHDDEDIPGRPKITPIFSDMN